MARPAADTQTFAANWPMLVMLGVCYAGWAVATVWLPVWAALPVLIVTITLHSSLCHEALHGHPSRFAWVNAALVFPQLGLLVPYLRFCDTHLAHHRDAMLTDPYDDPETNYLDPAVWSRLPVSIQWILRINNTLAGRMVLGPIIGQGQFLWSDIRAISRGNMRVLAGWLLHIPACALVIWWLATVGQVPVWAYALAVYGALSLLRLRTFLEHQAHDHVGGRTVVIESRGPLSYLFLNNNFHIVHHMHPDVPWHQLPALYAGNAARYLGRNDGYRYTCYGQIFRQHFWHAKDAVPHPLWKSPDL